MKLKIIDGKVSYLYQAGKDLVSAAMDADVAERIVRINKPQKMTPDHPGYPLCVGDVWFFPVEEETDEPKQEVTRKTGKAKKSEAKG